MALEEGIRHKSGPLKQQNKTHKHGRHRSKSEVDKTNKGCMSVFSIMFRENCFSVLVEPQKCFLFLLKLICGHNY